MRGHRLFLPTTLLALSLVAISCEPGSGGSNGGREGPNFIPPQKPQDAPWGLENVALPRDRESIHTTFSTLLGTSWAWRGWSTPQPVSLALSSCVSSPTQACYEDADGSGKLPQSVQGSPCELHLQPNLHRRYGGPHPATTVRGFFRRFVPRVFKRGLGDLEGFDNDPVDGLLWVATRPDPATAGTSSAGGP